MDQGKSSGGGTADGRQIEALQEEAISERAKRRVVVFKNLEVRPSERPQRVQVRVTLAFGEKEAHAEEVGTDTTPNRGEPAPPPPTSSLAAFPPHHSISLCRPPIT